MIRPNVVDNEELFTSIRLGGPGGLYSPGQVTLRGHDRKIDWDVKIGPQLSGATVTLKNIPPIEFTASFYMVKDIAQGIDDFALWPDFQAKIDATLAGTVPKAVDIYHPDLAAQVPPITAVLKGTVGGPVYDGKGGITIEVKFQEYRPAKPKGGTSLGSTSGPDPNADVKAKLKDLTAKYQATPWG